jgi:hypothetical protein
MPRTFPRSKHVNISYKEPGACAAIKDMRIATQHNICAANQERRKSNNGAAIARNPTR